MQISSLMKNKILRFLPLGLLALSFWFTLGITGCATPDYKGELEPPDLNTNVTLPRLTIGDKIVITLTGLPDQLEAQEKEIEADGTISLPNIGRVQAAGKTPGELADYIHSLYVPAIYTHLDVNVKPPEDAQFFVRGEVHSPGRVAWLGPITVTKAITSAGDFTDFANHKKVYLIRSSGKRFKLNVDDILTGAAPDPPVFPGDQIEVKRKIF
jgi:polysaccharide export outer membrane protein